MKPFTKAAVQGAACGLMLGIVLLLGGQVRGPAIVAAQTPSVAEVVRARSFEVVGAGGRQRAVLGVLPDGRAGLGLYDVAGKPRASLNLSANGPSLYLLDASGKPRAGVNVDADGSRLVLFDATGTPRTSLSVSPDGPTLRLQDPGGKTRAALSAFAGGAGLALLDAAEELRAGLGVQPSGSPGLGMQDAAGKTRVTLDLVSEGMPKLVLFDSAGKMREGLGVDANGPSLGMFDETEKPQVSLGTASFEGGKTGVEGSLPVPSLLLFGKDGKVTWKAP